MFFMSVLNVGCAVVLFIVGIIVFVNVYTCHSLFDAFNKTTSEKPTTTTVKPLPAPKDEIVSIRPGDHNIYVIVTSERATAREKPDEDAPMLYVFKKGDEFQLIQLKEEWCEVKVQYGTCWIPKKDLKPK